MNHLLTLFIIATLVSPLVACDEQGGAVPKVEKHASASSSAGVPAANDFYIKVDECYKKNKMPIKTTESETTGLTGKWAVPISRDVIENIARDAGVEKKVYREWGGNLGWSQFIDINNDGLCDYVETLPYTLIRLAINPDNPNPTANGYALVIHLHGKKDSKKYYSSDVDSDLFDGPFDGIYTDSIELPGGNGDRAVVLKVYSRLGGMPYILIPRDGLVRHSGSGVNFPEPQLDAKGIRVGMDPVKPEFNGAGGGWDIIRWDPKLKKFRNVIKVDDPIFSPENAEYWSVLAWLAERNLDDGLQAFKARQYSTAETLLELAANTDPRNLDILTWRAHFAYASARYKEATALYEQVVLRDLYATAKPPLEQTYFDLGLSLEAQCWQQLRDRKPGDPQGCADSVFHPAQAAYQTYLKRAPNGARAAEVKQRLHAMQQGVFRPPVGDAELAASAQWVDKLAQVFVQATRRASHPEPRPVPTPETGQPQAAKQADVDQLNPQDLRKIDQEINHLLQIKGLAFEQSRIDWMIAYKAKFPGADLNDMIARPTYYEALPWVKTWRKTYSNLPK
ncbi:MAG: hypothetical protein ABIT70_08445 [Sulfuriferula sp.]